MLSSSARLRGLDGGALHRPGESQTLLITGEQPGGLLTTTSIVENFPGWPEGIDGYELMTKMQAQAERFGTRVKFGSWCRRWISQTPLRPHD